jgi:hypothetical protein
VAVVVAALAAGSPGVDRDTLRPRDVAQAPTIARLDSAAWGAAPVRIETRQGGASAWLLRASDTLFVVVRVVDRTVSWADAVAVCLDVAGDRAEAPGHNDFQLALHRTLDSSVVYRGRVGRWEPPLGDPDRRVGPIHAGGGWSAATAEDATGWSLVLQLDPAWLAGQEGRPPALALQVHDDDPNGWYGWPAGRDAATLDRVPSRWGTVLPAGSP